MHVTRRSAIVGGARLAAVGFGGLALAGRAFAQPAADKPTQPSAPIPDPKPTAGDGPDPRKRPPIDPKNVPDKGPRIDSAMVFEFVYFAHSNLEVIKDMLGEQPKLVTAAWDWGGGDWETALGAASHMGRRDIAELLLSTDVRIDLFAATMLGKIDIVKATLAAFPEAINVPGPHGIPLIAHAKKGGEQAKEVLEFLQAQAAKSK